MSDTAHLLNSPITGLSKMSPHLIWHAVSSAALLHVLIQITLARQFTFVMHLASGRRHLLRRQSPIAFPSAAKAGSMFWIGPRVLNEIVKATRAEVTPFPS